MIHCENIICIGPHGAQLSVIDWRRLHMPRSLSRGVSEMHTRCAYCGGKFGLVRQQWFQTQFCSKRCREKFLTKLTKDKDRVRQWLGFSKGDVSQVWKPDRLV